MTLEKQSDWRGNSIRFPEGKYLVDELREWQKAHLKFCEIVSENGLEECAFLSSALSHWRMFTPNLAGDLQRMNKGNMVSLQTGVDQGLAIGVKIIAGCQECGRHSSLSMTLWTELMPALLSKSLVLNPPVGTFITWRLEIGNTFQHGQWGMF